MISKAKIIILLLILLGVGSYFYKKSLPQIPKSEIGEKVDDLGREHLTDIYGKSYNSNPPTSGPHFPVWAKPGFYERIISDGYLIHSLEHGYIVISYDCTKITQSARLVKSVSAHEELLVLSQDSKEKLMHMNFEVKGAMSWFTPENPPAVEVGLPQEFNSNECSDLTNKLKVYLDDQERVIIVPRVGMDTKIALTAWTRILKLTEVDDTKIKEFIETYHNKGPERTVE